MPPTMKSLLARLRSLFRRDVVAGEIHDELEFHVEMRVEEYERNGFSREEARRRARRRVGNIAVHQDRGYDVRGGGVIETVLQDVRYAFRLWRRQPGFAIAAIVTLASGIGISTALFSVIDAALLRPLPYPHPEQLVSVTVEEKDSSGEIRRTGASLNDARDWRDGSHAISAAGIMRAMPMPMVVDAGAGPERVNVSEIAEGCLELYQMAPLLGHGLTRTDLSAGAPHVALLGYRYWQSHFAGRRDVLGRVVRFADEGPATVIGVLPADFYPRTALWRPHTNFNHSDMSDRRGMGTDAYARLRPGVSLPMAEAEMTDVARRVARERGQSTDVRVTLEPLRTSTVSGYGTTISILTAAVGFVLLIACVNVAGLLMARGTARQSELAIRASIGAGRGRLVRQLLTESLVLAVAAAVLGAMIAWAALDSLVSLIPLDLPYSSSPTLNLSVLAFSIALSAATSLAFGLMPAITLSRAAVALGAVSGHRRLGSSAFSRRSGQLLIGVEVATAIMLLVGAGLMVRSLNRAMSVDIGFNPDAVTVMNVAPVTQTPAALSHFYPALLERLRAHPAIASVGAVAFMPLGGLDTFGFASSPAQESQGVRLRQALPGYVEAMGLTVIEGRIPLPAEFDSGRFVMLNKAAATTLFPDSNAVGKAITLSRNTREVVAVVADIRQDGPTHEAAAEVIWLASRNIREPMSVVIRARPGARLNPAELREVAKTIDAESFVEEIGPVRDLVTETVAKPRHRTLLFSLLGGLGFVLTLVGIFGTTAYAVARRTQEIGVRMAFGASAVQVVRVIVSDAAWPVAAGLLVGLGGATLGTKVIAQFLFQTTPTDPGTFAVVAIVLAIAGGLAAWIPARRAARVDPVAALRAE